MKIGLLECDTVHPDLHSIGGNYRDMFPALLPALDFVNFKVCNGEFPGSANDFDAWICTGSKFSVYDEVNWILELKSFVKDVQDKNKHFIGVCFGHQLLAEALGGRVQKGSVGWCVGVHTFETVQTEQWMEPCEGDFNLLMSCQDQVVEMPENGIVLAKSADCPVGMFRVGEKMLGIQGHPEFPVSYAAALMDMRKERIGEPKVLAAKESFTKPVHSSSVARWMLNFLGT